jgi:hypothetical protein
MRQILLIISILLTVTALNAHATWSSAGKNEGKDPVYCEVYLTGVDAKQMEEELEHTLIGRPFTYMSMLGGRPAARDALGILNPNDDELHNLIMSVSHSDQLDPSLFENESFGAGEVNPLVLQIQNFSNGLLEAMFLSTFPDETPTLWYSAFLEKHEKNPDYVKIRNAHPLGRIEDENEIGFCSDPSSAGVRTYVSIHREANRDMIVAEVGVDVPCKDLKKYAFPSDLPRPILTSGVNYCRVPVVLFGTPEI